MAVMCTQKRTGPLWVISGIPQVILKVYLSNSSDTVSEIPVTPATTCKDVIDCCKEPGEEQCHLAELWRGCERPIGDEEKPYEILQQWGIHREEVKFFLRHENAVPLGNVNPGNFKLFVIFTSWLLPVLHSFTFNN
ncbi:apoptosis-stimulating of p53 protein 1-like [Saccoglossus kowalevskii]